MTTIINIKLFTGNIEELRPIGESWQVIASQNDLGIEVIVDKFLIGAQLLALSTSSDLLVLYKDGEPVGLIGLQYFDSPLGNQVMANERYFFVMPEHRGISSIRLKKEAENLAMLKGCTHIIFNASNLASKLHDKVCSLYEKTGCAKFETSYIKELKQK